MILRRDRVRCRFRHALNHVDLFDIHFKSAGCARLGADLSADDDRRLLRQILDRLERLFWQVRFHGDALNDARAVAQQVGMRFCLMLSQVIEPSCDFDGLALACLPASATVVRFAVIILSFGIALFLVERLQTLEALKGSARASSIGFADS